MGKYDFYKDIVTGETGELVIMDLLIRLKPKWKIIERRKDNKYDFAVQLPSNKINTYEVKTDVYSKPGRETGNMFIEFESRGKKSGIETTEADYIVYFYPNWKRAWFINRTKLQLLLLSQNFPVTEFSGDRFSNTKGYLIPRWNYFNEFKVYQFNDETFTTGKKLTTK